MQPKHGGAHTTHNMLECRKYNKDGTPKYGGAKKSFSNRKGKACLELGAGDLSERTQLDELEEDVHFEVRWKIMSLFYAEKWSLGLLDEARCS